MVEVNCSVLVAGLGKCPFGLAEEAWFSQYEVVNEDTFPWLGGKKTVCLLLHSLPLHVTLVIAPNRQPEHPGAWTSANLLGVSPW
jgi:hypothetical protein